MTPLNATTRRMPASSSMTMPAMMKDSETAGPEFTAADIQMSFPLEAAAAYARFLALWAHADPALQPLHAVGFTLVLVVPPEQVQRAVNQQVRRVLG